MYSYIVCTLHHSADQESKSFVIMSGKLKSYLPTVVNQHGEGAEAEDPQSSEQLTQTLHPEGTGILKGQSCWETVGLLDHHRPGGGGAQWPQRQEVRKWRTHATAYQHHPRKCVYVCSDVLAQPIGSVSMIPSVCIDLLGVCRLVTEEGASDMCVQWKIQRSRVRETWPEWSAQEDVMSSQLRTCWMRRRKEQQQCLCSYKPCCKAMPVNWIRINSGNDPSIIETLAKQNIFKEISK